ncbi:uncharacterized protein [Miscanthus floridulus]|uniref:uncharacterized protein n=1 Tax=Miscanthus floridulus TaxID=154761 RepID=UPI00345822BE
MGSAVAFAKFSVERYPKAAAAVGVKGFSTVLLFVNDTKHAYHGLRTRLLHIKENHEFQKIRVSGKIHHIASARLIVHLNSPRSFKKAAAPISVSICNTVSPEPSSSLPLP